MGTVWIATITRDGGALATRLLLEGDRAAVRRSTVRAALKLLSKAVQG